MLHLAGFTMVGMPLIAYVIDVFSDDLNLRARIFGGEEWYIQIGVGIAAGLVSAIIASVISSMNFLQKSASKYTELIMSMNLNRNEIIFISICAGFGEEILFRGAIQPFWGIYITAVFFVAIHGYLSLRDWRISIYGIVMTVIIIGLGYITEIFGLWSAIIAHAIIDLYLLLGMERDRRKELESRKVSGDSAGHDTEHGSNDDEIKDN